MIKKVEICGVNTSKLPILSNEEKNELLTRIKQGDEKAREEFINRKFKISFKCYTKVSEEEEKAQTIYFRLDVLV